MAKENTTQENPDDALLAEAKERFTTAISFWGEEYDRAEFDTKFAFGVNQWPDAVRARREKEGRPCLQENQLLPFIHQVLNDIRQTRPAINVLPADDKADKETARILKGMTRNIENQSNADNVYDTGAQSAIQGGYGYLRVGKRYADDVSFKQELYLDRVVNFQSVVPDCNAQSMDGTDWEYCFIYDKLPRKQFEKEYPKANPVSWQDFKQNGTTWCDEEVILIAEYFYKVYTDVELALLPDGQTVALKDVPEGVKPVATRTARVPSVKWCKLTGAEVLEKTDWDGIYIPIVPVYGEEVFFDGKRRFYSLIHQGIDPQMRVNYWISANTEMVALQPKAPYIGAKGSFKTHSDKWASANNETFAFLEYDLVTLENGQIAPPPQRQQPPQGSAAMFQETLSAIQGVKNTLGIFDASLGRAGNETSGRAIIARQQEGDNATFHFVDNLATSIRQVGRILVDLIPKVYTGAQIVRIIGDDGEEKNVPINQSALKVGEEIMPITPGVRGEIIPIDPSVGKYDVVCVVGPSYATKRQEAAAQLTELSKADPRLMEVAGDIIIQSLDVEGADRIADRIKKAMPPQYQDDNGDPSQQALQQASQQIQEMQLVIQQMEQALAAKNSDAEFDKEIKRKELELKAEDLQIKAAETMAKVQQMQMQSAGQQESKVAIATLMQTIAELQSNFDDVSEAMDLLIGHHEQQMMPPPAVEQIPQQLGQ